VQLNGLSALANAQSAGGVAAAVLGSALIVGLHAYFLKAATASAGAAHVAANVWKKRAARGAKLVAVGFAFQSFGILASTIGLVIPWLSGESLEGFEVVSAFSTVMYTCPEPTADIAACSPQSELNNVFFGAAVTYIVGLAGLVVPSWLIAMRISLALMRVHKFGKMPVGTVGLPVVLGLAWGSYALLQGFGAFFLFGFMAALRASQAWHGAASGVVFGAGAPLLGAGLVATFIANVLYSAASCCGVGGLPGIGVSPRNCCMTATEHNGGDGSEFLTAGIVFPDRRRAQDLAEAYNAAFPLPPAAAFAAWPPGQGQNQWEQQRASAGGQAPQPALFHGMAATLQHQQQQALDSAQTHAQAQALNYAQAQAQPPSMLAPVASPALASNDANLGESSQEERPAVMGRGAAAMPALPSSPPQPPAPAPMALAAPLAAVALRKPTAQERGWLKVADEQGGTYYVSEL